MNAESPEAPECNGHPAGEFDPMGETVYCDGSCVHAVSARALNDSLSEILTEASAVGQKLVDQRERYAAVAEAAIDVLSIVEKTVAAKGSPELQNALSAGLKVRGISIERVKSLLGLIAAKEG